MKNKHFRKKYHRNEYIILFTIFNHSGFWMRNAKEIHNIFHRWSMLLNSEKKAAQAPKCVTTELNLALIWRPIIRHRILIAIIIEFVFKRDSVWTHINTHMGKESQSHVRSLYIFFFLLWQIFFNREITNISVVWYTIHSNSLGWFVDHIYPFFFSSSPHLYLSFCYCCCCWVFLHLFQTLHSFYLIWYSLLLHHAIYAVLCCALSFNNIEYHFALLFSICHQTWSRC